MNASRIQQQIESLRSELHAKLDALAKVVAEESGDAPSRKTIVTIAEYATHAAVSIATVRRWINDGLPCRRRGRAIRIEVDMADAWCRADHISKSAEHNAHRGGQ